MLKLTRTEATAIVEYCRAAEALRAAHEDADAFEAAAELGAKTPEEAEAQSVAVASAQTAQTAAYQALSAAVGGDAAGAIQWACGIG